jgi:2-polyprenyl-3-methyl-5-hydroxy-6-metoxy-1,4-benzoquinol methylase
MTMTLDDLRNSLDGPSEEYRRKQLHPVPEAKVVDREAFILERVVGKVVLDIGASGRMHEAVMRASEFCYGIEKPGVPAMSALVRGDHIEYLDLDDCSARLPQFKDVQIVVCGEVIEHLSNPGWFLKRLRAAYKCPVIITVPNAFNDGCRKTLERGVENVNNDHVAWYSFHTLSELVRREGYEVKEHYWYTGRPRFAEGLIFVVE